MKRAATAWLDWMDFIPPKVLGNGSAESGPCIYGAEVRWKWN